MAKRDDERAAVRQLRDALGMTRDQFADLLTGLGHSVSTVTIENYEKEVPAKVLQILAIHAQENGLQAIADRLRPANDAATIEASQGKPLGGTTAIPSVTVSQSDILAPFKSQLDTIQANTKELLEFLKAAPRRDEAHTDSSSRGDNGNGEVAVITGGLDKELEVIESDKPRGKKALRAKNKKTAGK